MRSISEKLQENRTSPIFQRLIASKSFTKKKFHRFAVVQIRTSELSWVNSDLGEKVQVPVDHQRQFVIPAQARITFFIKW